MGRFWVKLLSAGVIALALTVPMGSALPGDDVPSSPQNLRAHLGTPGENDVLLTWSAPLYVTEDGITSYQINGLVGGLWQPLATVDGDVYSLVHTGALPAGPGPGIVVYEIIPNAPSGVGHKSLTLDVESPGVGASASGCNAFGVTIPQDLSPPTVHGDMACLVDTLAGPLPDEVEPIVRQYFWKVWYMVNVY